jgi:hypothetical protein
VAKLSRKAMRAPEIETSFANLAASGESFLRFDRWITRSCPECVTSKRSATVLRP